MKKFLEKHILFPRRFGWMPYFYLVFMLPAAFGIYYVPNLYLKIIGVILLLAFLKLYRDGYEATPRLTLQIVLQLLIATFFGMNPWVTVYGLHIFTAWEIGMSQISRKQFQRYSAYYYFSASLTYIVSMSFIMYWHYSFASYGMLGFYLSVIFVFVSPVLARSINEGYSLRHRNKHLEAQILQLERERIAYDLHDSLGQTLSTITLQAELVARLIDKEPIRAREELERIAEHSRENLTLVREIVSDLRAEDIAQVLQEARSSLGLADIDFTIEGEWQTVEWPRAVRRTVAAVLKEALTNVVRHSQARQVRVGFEMTESQYLLSVRDDGVGLGKTEASHGLVGMARRVEESGGELSVVSEDGVTLVAALPKKEDEDDNTFSRR